MYKLRGPFTPSESEKDHKEQVKEIKEKNSNISFRFRLRWMDLNNENWVLKILTSRIKHTSSSGMTLGLTYNEFGYYEHPVITSNFFSQERALLSSVTRSTAYNEQIFMNWICIRDPVHSPASINHEKFFFFEDLVLNLVWLRYGLNLCIWLVRYWCNKRTTTTEMLFNKWPYSERFEPHTFSNITFGNQK